MSAEAGAMHRSCALIGELDMGAERKVAIERTAGDGPAGQRAKGRGADEVPGGAGHHDGNAVTALHERTYERGGFVGRDSAGDADDEFVGHGRR